MNVPAGFTTGFSFFYTSAFSPGSVTVYDGLNGTGNVLATLNLSPLGACAGADLFCNWQPVGVNFIGTAHSANFSGAANLIAFDNITIGSATAGGGAPVPEPGTFALLGIGMAGLIIRQYFLSTSARSC